MGEINVEGLGIVNIEGDVPTAAEEQAIIEAIQGKQQVPEVEEGRRLRPNIEGQLMPEPVLKPDPRPFLTQVTEGKVTPQALQTIGATAGGLVGGAAGVATGPGAPAAAPAGVLAGATLGAGMGQAAFDMADTAAKLITGQPQTDEFLDPSKRAAQAMGEEFMFTAAAGSLGPVFKAFSNKVAKPLTRKVLGIGEEAVRVARAGESQGVNVGILQASERPTVKGFSRVLGVFPFVGGPIKKGAERTGRELAESADSILNEIAPNGTMADIGVDLAEAAKGRFSKFKNIAAAMYRRFETLAEGASDKDIFPTTQIKTKATEFAEAVKQGEIRLEGGKTLKAPNRTADEFNAFVADLSNLPDKINIQQYRQLQQDLQALANKFQNEGFDLKRLVQLKKAFEVDLNNPLVDTLAPEEAQQIVVALRNANAFYAETIKRFETATAKRFGRVDKNIFGAGRFAAGTLNEDELFKAVFRSKSPQAVADLKGLTGKPAFRKAVRQHFQESFDRADGGALTEKYNSLRRFDVDKFAENIGLGTQDGRRALQTMLEGTGVRVRDLENFVDVAKAQGSIAIPNTSLFIQRRVTLAGMKALMTLGVGSNALASPVSTGVGVLMSRYASKILSSPEYLRSLTTALKDNVPDLQRRSLILRVTRQLIEAEGNRPSEEK